MLALATVRGVGLRLQRTQRDYLLVWYQSQSRICVFLFYSLLFFFFFFFQAEDGIRDLYVTGVQTCALPISITFGLDRHSVYLWTLPMFHCNGWTYTWGVTAAAGTHVCLRRVEPEAIRSEEHTSELQSRRDLVCRLLLEKKNNKIATLLRVYM